MLHSQSSIIKAICHALGKSYISLVSVTAALIQSILDLRGTDCCTGFHSLFY